MLFIIDCSQPPTRSPKLRRTLKQPLSPPRRMQLRLLPRIFLLWSRPRRKSWPEETHDVGCSRTMCLLHLDYDFTL